METAARSVAPAPQTTIYENGLLLYPMLPDFRNNTDFRNVPRLRPFDLPITVTCSSELVDLYFLLHYSTALVGLYLLTFEVF
jgi:hypothetical protein